MLEIHSKKCYNLKVDISLEVGLVKLNIEMPFLQVVRSIGLGEVGDLGEECFLIKIPIVPLKP